MGSYNSINFLKLIVEGIPYNKAYMGSKILFENTNPFTLEITGYKSGSDKASLYYRKGSNTQENCTFYITCGNNTYTKRSTNTTGSYLTDDNNNRVYFYSGDKIKIKVVYDNNDTPVVGTYGAGITLAGCYFKVYGDLTTYNANGYYESLLSASNAVSGGDGLTDISGIMWPDSVSAYCYRNMFYNQANLTQAIDLPATTLAFRCYTNMLYHTGVTDITMHALDYSPLDAASVSPGGFNQFLMTGTQPTNGGVFRLPAGNNLAQFSSIEGKAPNAEDQKWTIQPIGTPLQTNPITVTSLAADNRIYFKCLSATGTVKYNNNTAYQTLSEGDEITLGTIGNQETLQVKYAYTGTVSLMGTGDFTVSGDIIDVNDGVTPGMFKNSTHLTSAKDLVLSPVTLTHNECYQSMFEGCTGLTSAGCPDLIATTLTESCYDSMFKGCTGLTSMVYFKFDKDIVWADYCCYGMYQGCTGIGAAEISTTGYPTYWYPDSYDQLFCYMFEGCTNLNQLYVWGDSVGYVNYFNHIIDNCSQTGVKKIFIQEDTDFMYGNVNDSKVKPTGWTIEEDDSNF